MDSDIIVLRPLSSLQNSVGMEDQAKGSRLNGAVMAFKKHRYLCHVCVCVLDTCACPFVLVIIMIIRENNTLSGGWFGFLIITLFRLIVF